jgi:hypothetical protein
LAGRHFYRLLIVGIVLLLCACGLISGRGEKLAADPYLGQSVVLDDRDCGIREFIDVLESQCRLDVWLTTNMPDSKLGQYKVNVISDNRRSEYRANLPLKAYQALDLLRTQHDKLDGPRVYWNQQYKRRINITFVELTNPDAAPN